MFHPFTHILSHTFPLISSSNCALMDSISRLRLAGFQSRLLIVLILTEIPLKMSFPATTPAAAPGGDIQPLGQGPNDTAKNTLW